MVKIKELKKTDLEDILRVETKAFIPPIQADKKVIGDRLNKNHIYLGAFIEGNTDLLVGTVACRQDQFVPDFADFIVKHPNFEKWANRKSEPVANALFIYSLGVVPEYRNGLVAKALIGKALEVAQLQKKDFFVGDMRVPSYNGSCYPGFEKIKQNHYVKSVIDESLLCGKTMGIKELAQDPIVGFYLRILPRLRALGITDAKFLEKDVPSGGRRVLVYQDLRK
ncbi:MAG: hypothetical protein Q8L34_02140 [Candidatus Woesearchaeota archaeon]|nr:hypothetical protein [Candidatus Woesearchaeota archaeon]